MAWRARPRRWRASRRERARPDRPPPALRTACVVQRGRGGCARATPRRTRGMVRSSTGGRAEVLRRDQAPDLDRRGMAHDGAEGDQAAGGRIVQPPRVVLLRLGPSSAGGGRRREATDDPEHPPGVEPKPPAALDCEVTTRAKCRQRGAGQRDALEGAPIGKKGDLGRSGTEGDAHQQATLGTLGSTVSVGPRRSAAQRGGSHVAEPERLGVHSPGTDARYG